MKVQLIFIYFRMSLRNVYRLMVRYSIGVIYLKSEIDIFYGNRQIRVFKRTVPHKEIGVISRKMFLVVFPFYKSVEINLSIRFNTGEISLVNGWQHRKDIFEFCRGGFVFDIHVIGAVIDPLKESFSMQFQIIERHLVGIKYISMGFEVNAKCHIYIGFSSYPVRDGSAKIKIDGIRRCFGFQCKQVGSEIAPTLMFKIDDDNMHIRSFVEIVDISVMYSIAMYVRCKNPG